MFMSLDVRTYTVFCTLITDIKLLGFQSLCVMQSSCSFSYHHLLNPDSFQFFFFHMHELRETKWLLVLRDPSCACIIFTVSSPELVLCCDERTIITCWDAIANAKAVENPITCGLEILFHELGGLRDDSFNPTFT
jgi:hypothetical protein